MTCPHCKKSKSFYTKFVAFQYYDEHGKKKELDCSLLDMQKLVQCSECGFILPLKDLQQ